MASFIKGDRLTASNLRMLGTQGLPLTLVDQAGRVALAPMLKDAKARARQHRNYIGKYSRFPQPKKGRVHLDQALVVGKQGKQSKWRRKILLGARRRARKIAHLLEFGTAPHFQPNFRGGFFHPGAKAKPFMTPAFEAHKRQVSTEMGKQLWRVIMARVLQVGRSSRVR